MIQLGERFSLDALGYDIAEQLHLHPPSWRLSDVYIHENNRAHCRRHLQCDLAAPQFPLRSPSRVKQFQTSSCPDPRQMSYFLPHLPSGWHVDEAIKSEEDRVVVIRFGHDWDSQCMTMDETLYSVAEKVQNFAVIYLVDITEVPDFNKVARSSHS